MPDRKLKILFLVPFYSGSHKAWADGLVRNVPEDVILWTLPGKHWKWRMYGAAITFAQRFLKEAPEVDLILTTDMLDLSVFKALLGAKKIPIAVYFHENQLTYPWSKDDSDPAEKRDHHYGFTNYTSCLSADWVYFNSDYHQTIFLGALAKFLKKLPDFRNLETIRQIQTKSSVLDLGMDYSLFEGKEKSVNEVPVILWNHRWEYDKNPSSFFEALFQMKEEGLTFQLVVLGQSYKNSPPIFAEAKRKLSDEIIHWGYAESKEAYAKWLLESDLIPVTSKQDFFGISLVEAMYAGVHPLVPNRLAFPGHFLEGGKRKYLYEGQEGLVEKLRHLLANPSLIEVGPFGKERTYDWNLQSNLYAKAFREVVISFPV